MIEKMTEWKKYDQQHLYNTEQNKKSAFGASVRRG